MSQPEAWLYSGGVVAGSCPAFRDVVGDVVGDSMANLVGAEQTSPSSRGDVSLDGQPADPGAVKSHAAQDELGALDHLQLQQGLEMFGTQSIGSMGLEYGLDPHDWTFPCPPPPPLGDDSDALQQLFCNPFPACACASQDQAALSPSPPCHDPLLPMHAKSDPEPEWLSMGPGPDNFFKPRTLLPTPSLSRPPGPIICPQKVDDAQSALWPSREVCSLIADALSLPPATEVRLHADDAVDLSALDEDEEADLLRCGSCGTALHCGLRACGCDATTSGVAVEQARAASGSGSLLLQRLRNAASKQGRGTSSRGSVQVIWEKQQTSATDSIGSSGSDADLASPLFDLQQPLPLPQPPQPAAQPRKRKRADKAEPARKRPRTQAANASPVAVVQASKTSGPPRRRGRPPGRATRSSTAARRRRSVSRGRSAGRRGGGRARSPTRRRVSSANRVSKRGRRAGERCSECGRAMPKLGWLSMVGRAIKRAIVGGERPYCSTCWRKLPQRRRRGDQQQQPQGQPPLQPEQQQQQQQQQQRQESASSSFEG